MQGIIFQILLKADVLQISKLKGELVDLSTRVRASSGAEVQLLQMTYDDCPCQNELGGDVVVNVSWRAELAVVFKPYHMKIAPTLLKLL